MAERSSFFCVLCEKHYDFRSRFDRHLASSGHCMLEEIQKLNQGGTSSVTESTVTDSANDGGAELSLASDTLQTTHVDVSSFLYKTVVM